MLYQYDKKSLNFRKLRFSTILKTFVVMVGLFGIIYYIGYNRGIETSFSGLSDMEKVIKIKEHDKFSKEKLITMMKELNVQYPWIPMAQSMLETGEWNSNIFHENNNLFGMKEAKMRVTSAGGTQNGHAYYETWRESVYDYAFYQCRYLNSIHSEESYFQYLSSSYAEDPNYVNKVKKILKDNKLKEEFINN